MCLEPIEQGESPLPVHFVQINQRDGFFLVAREPDAAFEWSKLAGYSVLADHAGQPLVMLKNTLCDRMASSGRASTPSMPALLRR